MVMRDAMSHGGPDDSGVYLDAANGLAFGHRRLSIIDLSAAGHQPMQREDIVLTFNGEIYNYEELRQQLKANGQSFSTNSDTEVIIRAYQQWGTACFGRFRGMFALVIYDKLRNELILARDHAGIKPLYYSFTNEKLYFGSEIRAFKALGYWHEREDWQLYFLSYGFLPEPVTTLQGVKPLEKGSFLVVNLNSFKAVQEFYYREKFTDEIKDLEEAKQLIRNSLTKSVERHLISDAPIGLFLSGGIDSSLLTILAQPIVPDSLHTLSLVFEDQQFTEQAFQNIIIEKTGAKHQSFLVTKQDFEDCFDDIIHSMDQPSTDGINSYFICKYARKAGLKAVLSGLGGDELLGGYPSFRRSRYYNKLKNIPGFLLGMAGYAPKDNHRKLSFLERKDPVGEYLFYRGYYTPAETSRLLGCSIAHVKEVLANISVPRSVAALSPGNRVSYLESNLYMQSQLLKDTDAMSMWHSLEVRVPFLDRDFMDVVHRISPQVKFDHPQGKYLLIESFKDLLPREIWDRKKQGFVLPFSKWMKGKQLTQSGKLSVVKASLHRRFNNGKLSWSRYWAYMLATSGISENDAVHGSTVTLFENGHAKSLNGHRPVIANTSLNGASKRNGPLPKVLFLNLTTFSHAGGIEKFNRCFLKALQEMEGEGMITSMGMSPYDDLPDERYYAESQYRGFKGSRLMFMLEAVRKAKDYDQVVIGHLNLSPIGYLVRKFYPGKKIILITHGIEVWQPVHGVRHKMLEIADTILSVSNFTKQKLIDIQSIPEQKIRVFPNTIDPFFPVPQVFKGSSEVRSKYSIADTAPVILTLSRLSSREQYKGYDIIIECLPALKKRFPAIRYIIAGKYDAAEKARLDQLISNLDLADNVIMTGYLPEQNLIDYYQAADLFVMPSRKEGFGIVFLEALICGMPVMGGNQDGSVDALRNGELGLLVNPTNKDEIIEGITTVLHSRDAVTNEYRKSMQQKTIGYFGFDQYRKRLEEVII
jgi:asparagine synthase (glutamine-hydrolysing)